MSLTASLLQSGLSGFSNSVKLVSQNGSFPDCTSVYSALSFLDGGGMLARLSGVSLQMPIKSTSVGHVIHASAWKPFTAFSPSHLALGLASLSRFQENIKIIMKARNFLISAVVGKHSQSETENDSVGQSMIPEKENGERELKSKPSKAAFFDVDGTITRTNVVMAYFAARMVELPMHVKVFWVPWFGLTGIFYLLLDRIDRALFNRIFYRSYNGRSVKCKAAMSSLIYEKYYKPRIFTGAEEIIQQLKERHYEIVFVTGALDFQIAPLAHDLGADFMYAAELVEKDGRFTGKLKGMAISNTEKADRVLEYSRTHGVSLAESLAFGDSIADISMLELVGQPHAVNPDSRLQAIAQKRGWPILLWSIKPREAAIAAASV